jgi:hypothetical protein
MLCTTAAAAPRRRLPPLVLTATLGQLRSVAPGTYTIGITLTNIFDVAASANLTFTISLASPDAPPAFSLVSGAASFAPSQSVTIAARWAAHLSTPRCHQLNTQDA